MTVHEPPLAELPPPPSGPGRGQYGPAGHDHDATDHDASDHDGPDTPASRLQRFNARLPVWLAPAAVGGMALTACVYVGLVDPSSQASPVYPACTFKALTGLDCPGCGLTRAMHSLMNGRPLEAIDHNLFILAIFPIALWMYVSWASNRLFGWNLPSVHFPRWIRVGVLPAVLLFTVVRNLPIEPFHWLFSDASLS